MSVCIRLARQGSKKRPFYRIVATDRRSPRDGRFIEQLGYYDPRKPDFRLDFERYKTWIGTGARPSDTVASLVKTNTPPPPLKA
jgi:small subunit ribosomal protein S16